MIKLAMMSYTMARGRWGTSPDIRQLCEFTRELGLDAIDFVTTYGCDPRLVRAIANNNGLTVVCYTFFAHSGATDAAALAGEQEALKTGLETALVMGAKIIMLPIVAKKGLPDEESRSYCADFLASAVELATKTGVTVSFENRTPVVVSKHVKQILAQIPGVKVTFDNGNVLQGGEDPVQAIKAYGRDIVHAHFKDWMKVDMGSAPPRAGGAAYTPAVIGAGIVDQKGCIAALRQTGYSGYINIEYDGRDLEPDVAVRRGVECLRVLLQDVS